MLTGHCECGSVAFTVARVQSHPSACHCSQCRRLSGHIWSGTSVAHDDLTFTSDSNLKWYRSSDHAQRGFCGTCGSSLFYKPDGADHVSVATGSFDTPTGLKLRRHIFVADKGDYYDIADDAPQFENY
ncbi:GFA family protein [Alisedimentitalea sp. MJ-SS2]|uniref:GFA family protein n=1 Tax=Aliisedimentitalea sp. MJ-SS2 TaxID=3049795 RepID=UPI002912A569|nr:GFA family protein [Alisedimentitalea sp. MJ-SS2]MDU8929245.1 GFA family protein [Alisedimentitalea sp. MJ-SS2]